MSEELIKFFGNHIVCLSGWHQVEGQAERFLNATAFIVSIGDMWVVVTAGHVMDEFRQVIEAGGNCVDWHIDDTMGTNPVSDQPMPFNLAERAHFQIYDQDLGYDYSLLEVKNHERRLLERNRIQAISEQAWTQGMPNEFEGYVLVGFPFEDIKCTPGRAITRAMTMVHLAQILDGEVPPVLIKTKDGSISRLYFRLPPDDANAPRSMKGMSGGPIFGYKRCADGLRYWLVGIQSAVAKSHPIAIACPTRLFFHFVSEYTKVADVDETAGS